MAGVGRSLFIAWGCAVGAIVLGCGSVSRVQPATSPVSVSYVVSGGLGEEYRYSYEAGVVYVDRGSGLQPRSGNHDNMEVDLEVQVSSEERQDIERALGGIDLCRLAPECVGPSTSCDATILVFFLKGEDGSFAEVQYGRQGGVVVPELDRLTEAIDDVLPRRYQYRPKT